MARCPPNTIHGVTLRSTEARSDSNLCRDTVLCGLDQCGVSDEECSGRRRMSIIRGRGKTKNITYSKC